MQYGYCIQSDIYKMRRNQMSSVQCNITVVEYLVIASWHLKEVREV